MSETLKETLVITFARKQLESYWESDGESTDKVRKFGLLGVNE